MWWLLFLLSWRRAAAEPEYIQPDKCFCSATGDPHIRDFDGQTSTVGAGEFTLLQDYSNRFNIIISVRQIGRFTQIQEVKVNLAGDVVDHLPGYGDLHKAEGIEIRVFESNNVFIIWDSSKGDRIKPQSLCGTQCGQGKSKLLN